MPKDKSITSGITDRFLLLMNEVISSGESENKSAFAKSVGEYQQNLAAMERGDRAPTLEQAAKICDVYGYSGHWLLTGHGPKKVDPTHNLPIETRVSDLERQVNQLIKTIHKKK